jgi:hypothetical protein
VFAPPGHHGLNEAGALARVDPVSEIGACQSNSCRCRRRPASRRWALGVSPNTPASVRSAAPRRPRSAVDPRRSTDLLDERLAAPRRRRGSGTWPSLAAHTPRRRIRGTSRWYARRRNRTAGGRRAPGRARARGSTLSSPEEGRRADSVTISVSSCEMWRAHRRVLDSTVGTQVPCSQASNPTPRVLVAACAGAEALRGTTAVAAADL